MMQQGTLVKVMLGAKNNSIAAVVRADTEAGSLPQLSHDHFLVVLWVLLPLSPSSCAEVEEEAQKKGFAGAISRLTLSLNRH